MPIGDGRIRSRNAIRNRNDVEMGMTATGGDGALQLPRERRSRRTEKVSEVVAREIVHDIVSRDVRPGSMLPSEAVMLAEYDIGRASLREALRILEVHGLITIKPGPGGGPVVGEPDSRDFGKMATLYLHVARATFRELVEARLVLEPMMARIVAERADQKVHETLRASLTHMGDAVERLDHDQYLHASTDFHGIMAGVSGNVVLDLLARSMKDVFTDRVATIVFPEEERHRVVREHEEIARAIFKGDGAKAERLMREHMVTYRDKVSQQFPGVLDEVVDWR